MTGNDKEGCFKVEFVHGNLSLGVDLRTLSDLIGETCLKHGASVMLFNSDGSILLDMPDHDARRRNTWLCGNDPQALSGCTRLRSALIKRVLAGRRECSAECACGATVLAKPIAVSSTLFGGALICLPDGRTSPGHGMGHAWLESFIDTLTAMIAQNSFKDVEAESLSNELSVRYEELAMLYEIAEKLPLRTQPGAVIDFLVDQAWMVVRSDCICWVGHGSPGKLFYREGCEPDAVVSLRAQEAARIAADRASGGRTTLALNDLFDDDGLVAYANDFGAILVVPIATADELLGSLCLFKEPGREFRSDESMLVTSLARKAAAVMHNAKLYSQLNALFVNTLKTLVFVIEGKDAYTRGHSERVTQFSMMLGSKMNLEPSLRETLNWSALLHDIGKIKVPEAILQKSGKLSDAEWEVIKNHPVYGSQMLEPIEQLTDSLPAVRHHHERYDGGGYPAGLKGEDIPLGARVIAVADTFDALTSDRCYRPRFDSSQALDILREVAGTQLDPGVVRLLLDSSDEFVGQCQSQPGDNRADTRTVIGVDGMNTQHSIGCSQEAGCLT